MKKSAKKLIASILGWQVRRLRKKNDFKTVVVAGSIGKTSTKFAVATVLQQKYKVQYQQGNYNDIVSVPLVFFGLSMPSLFNPFAWLATFIKIEKTLLRNYPYDVVVLEVGTDAPGQIQQFSNYLQGDIGILTAISAEHMEFFEDLDSVAREEMQLATYSDLLILNRDLCADEYFKNLQIPYETYGKLPSDYTIENLSFKKGPSVSFGLTNITDNKFSIDISAVSIAEVYTAVSAIIIAHKLGLSEEQIRTGVSSLSPVNGRMRRLRGIKSSIILDDTYNASPVATKSSLDSLYAFEAPQKIAILGNMNELGNYSESAHAEIGEYCDPRQLDWVITIGEDANKYLAPAAMKKGCKVQTFDTPYDITEFIQEQITPNAVILAKGSQNGVYAEEAVKLLLDNPKDADKLVRQSDEWLKIKQASFKK